MSDDDFTDDEIADFEALPAESLKKIERFVAWQNKKNPKQPSEPSSKGSGPESLTLAQLKSLVADPESKSILQALLAPAVPSLNPDPNNPNPSPGLPNPDPNPKPPSGGAGDQKPATKRKGWI